MTENLKKQIRRAIAYQLAGWVLFIVCALFFIAASVKNKDALTFIGSVIFLVACIFFVIPLIRR